MWPRQSVEFPYWLPDLLQSLQANLILWFGYKHPSGDLHLHVTINPLAYHHSKPHTHPLTTCPVHMRCSAKREDEVGAGILVGLTAWPPVAYGGSAERSAALLTALWWRGGGQRSAERIKQAAVAHR